MKNQKNLFSSRPINILALFMAALLMSCNNNDDDVVAGTPSQNIIQVASANSNYSILVSAIEKAGLVNTLEGSGPFTVFAPTNAAFEAAGISSVDNFTADQLRPILLYHVLSGNNPSSGLTSGGLGTQSTGNDLYLSVNNSGVFINGDARVTNADLIASNGTIHGIDAVLMPPSENIVEIAAGEGSFSLLVQAATRAGLEETLSMAEDITVLAPTNAAFEAAGFDEAAINNASIEDLTRILTYHVIGSRIFTTDLTNTVVESLEGGQIDINVSASGAAFTGTGNETSANIIAGNILATNGVIHVIDQVLLPSGENAAQSIATIASENEDFSILTAALTKAGLVDVLDNDGDYTVFAPTNAAFEAAGITNLDDFTAEQLTPILLYHVLGRRVASGDISAGSSATLNEDADVYLSLNDGVYINGNVQVVTADIQASNGIIHVVDEVLLPPSQNIVEIALNDEENFSLLVRAVIAAGLVETLAETDGLTVFAPTNEAFLAAGLDEAAIDAASVEDLTSILTYHVLGSRVFSPDLENGEVSTLEGTTLTLNTDSGATVAGNSNSGAAGITQPNILATNGVIHVINQVLLP